MLSNFSYYGNYRTRTFKEIYEDYSELILDFRTIYGFKTPYGENLLSEDELKTIYYLLYGKFGSRHIMNSDENQFKFKLSSIIYQYGPTWAKKMEIQDILRNLPEDEIVAGTKTIYNHAYNPSTIPSTQSLEELLTIDDQNTTGYKRSKLESYGILWGLLTNDITENFLNKFKVLFIQIAQPDYPLWYVSEEEED